jgi:hypothetical protein
MKRFMLTLAAAALSLAAALPATAGAKAKPVAPAAEIISHVKTFDGGNAATVKARYVCPEGNHLWVSAKQSADGAKDPRLEGEGSSAFAAGWLQNHPANFTCDGKSHVGTFQVDNFTEYGFGQLRRGVAWVQFCVVSEATEALILSHSEWVSVK